jgi:hypothetical protein
VIRVVRSLNSAAARASASRDFQSILALKPDDGLCSVAQRKSAPKPQSDTRIIRSPAGETRALLRPNFRPDSGRNSARRRDSSNCKRYSHTGPARISGHSRRNCYSAPTNRVSHYAPRSHAPRTEYKRRRAPAPPRSSRGFLGTFVLIFVDLFVAQIARFVVVTRTPAAARMRAPFWVDSTFACGLRFHRNRVVLSQRLSPRQCVHWRAIVVSMRGRSETEVTLGVPTPAGAPTRWSRSSCW